MLEPHGAASKALFWVYSNRLPWNCSVPLFVLIVTSPSWANSALLLNWVTLNSPINSEEGFMLPSAPFCRMLTVEEPSTEYCTCDVRPPPTVTLTLASFCALGTVSNMAIYLMVVTRYLPGRHVIKLNDL